MIIIVTRDDLFVSYAGLPAAQLRLLHFPIAEETVRRAELIVFVEDSKIYFLTASKWPYGKPMYATDLLQYIANRVA